MTLKVVPIKTRMNGNLHRGLIAFDDGAYPDWMAACDATGPAPFEDPRLRAMPLLDVPDEAELGQGRMWLDGVSYGTCEFCPVGFRVRAEHFIGENPKTVCTWLETPPWVVRTTNEKEGGQ